MKLMAKAASFAFLLGVALSAMYCSPFGGASEFACKSDPECTGAADGRCEATGFCSFADEGCGVGGRRYGELGGPLAGKCVGDEPMIDAPVAVDVLQPEAGETCLGAVDGLVRPCFAVPPSGAITLVGPIDTDSSALCSTVVSNTTACVIAAGTIQVDAGTTFSATGSKPLVIAATGAVTINGTIDVASHRGVITVGAGGNDVGCAAGTPPTSVNGTGGGGAGGSFGATGGNGGAGTAGAGGIAGDAGTATTLHGGCRAQDGKEGGGAAATAGIGGNGGGAVYIIAGTTLTIGAGAVVNASGAGGINGVILSAGGGGGGSGGLIGLDAPTVANSGTIFANGGSGAEGSGVSNPGQPGTDPVGIAAATPSPPTSTSGGDGGNGGAGTPGMGGNGAPGNGGTTSGGGGGGGVGLIRVFPPQTLAGAVSPPAS